MRFFRREDQSREVHVKASLRDGEALEISVRPHEGMATPPVRISGRGRLDVAFPVRQGQGFTAEVVLEHGISASDEMPNSRPVIPLERPPHR